jgi:hypothetical protein
MDKTIVGLYDSLSVARDVVGDLIGLGFTREGISLAMEDPSGEYARFLEAEDETSDVEAGAGMGAVIGSLAGLLVGLSALVVPGAGPLVIAVPLLSALLGAGAGAVSGGLMGALVDMGVPEGEAVIYDEGVRRGSVLVVVTTSEARAEDAERVMERPGAIDVAERVSQWEGEGWSALGEEGE